METLTNLKYNQYISQNNDSSEINEQNKNILKCKDCECILTIPINSSSIKNDGSYIYIDYPYFFSIMTSKNTYLEIVKIDYDYFVYKKISCLECEKILGKYIISASESSFEILEKVKIENNTLIIQYK